FLLSGLAMTIVLPPSSMMLPAWHIGPVPPPHSSVQMVFLPSLLNPAVCRLWKLLVSVMADSRTGFSGFEMSTMMAWLEHAAASRWNAGYAVTSWQLRGAVFSLMATGFAESPGAPPPRRPRPPRARLESTGAQNMTHAGAPERPVKIRAPGITAA